MLQKIHKISTKVICNLYRRVTKHTNVLDNRINNAEREYRDKKVFEMEYSSCVLQLDCDLYK